MFSMGGGRRFGLVLVLVPLTRAEGLNIRRTRSVIRKKGERENFKKVQMALSRVGYFDNHAEI